MNGPARTPAERVRLLKQIEREIRTGSDESRACATLGVTRKELEKWRLLYGAREPKPLEPTGLDGESGFPAGDGDLDGGGGD
jgi:hypothetical protein